MNNYSVELRELDSNDLIAVVELPYGCYERYNSAIDTLEFISAENGAVMGGYKFDFKGSVTVQGRIDEPNPKRIFP